MNEVKSIALGFMFGLLATGGVFAVVAGVVEFASAARIAKGAGKWAIAKLTFTAFFCVALAVFYMLRPDELHKAPLYPIPLIAWLKRSWASAYHPIVVGWTASAIVLAVFALWDTFMTGRQNPESHLRTGPKTAENGEGTIFDER